MGRNEKAPPRKTDDPLEQVIGNLEENVHREMEKKSTELDKAQRAKEKVRGHVLVGSCIMFAVGLVLVHVCFCFLTLLKVTN